MRLIWIWSLLAFCVVVFAQQSTSSQPSSTPNATQNVITTTITSIIPSASGRNATTDVLTLTLTLNATAPEGNHTLSNGTVVAANGTILNNGTNTTVWHAGDGWIPFHIIIDPAYGVLGALFILSGIPVAILGGKNRWSSIAICSGYALMLFTLVLILRFGVQPSLQPPSPSPPTTSMRGLYLLACIIASFIGAGLGVFLYKFAKYSVAAAGGFTFAWFLLATKSGGLIDSVLGRWCLFGGVTVAAFVAGLPSKLTDVLMLISTAWIGATTFTLGIDCYTRAGLKEFYVYNLGFHSLFPKLEGAPYPLTQTMQIELGILAAVVLVGAAIQMRVLNRLQKRMRQIREEEEMRIEAEEVSKAAERFKNVGSELAEWEEKHGKSGSTTSTDNESPETDAVLLPPLNMDNPGYHTVSLESPLLVHTPSTAWHSVEELVPPEDDLHSKMKLLDDVRKARESIRGSLEDIRRAPTPSLSVDARSRRTSSASTQIVETAMSRDASRASILDRPRPYILDVPATREPGSVLDRPGPIATKTKPAVPGSTTSLLDLKSSTPTQSPVLSVQSDWDKYKSTRSIQPAPNRQSTLSADFGTLPRKTSTQSFTSQRAELDRIAMPPPPAPLRRSASAQPELNADQWGPGHITGSAATTLPSKRSSRALPRTLTYEQLSERHRKRLSELQNPVTSAMTQKVEAAEARERWERQQRAEREEMRRREEERREARHSRRESRDVLKSTAEWRNSVQSGLDQRAQPQKRTSSYVN